MESSTVNSTVHCVTPQVALELLEALFAHKEIHQNERKWSHIRRQLQKQSVAVSVLGRHGVGKSTLLDSLLRDR